jgi:uncharacterized protein YjbI with pentapeptide repeats
MLASQVGCLLIQPSSAASINGIDNAVVAEWPYSAFGGIVDSSLWTSLELDSSKRFSSKSGRSDRQAPCLYSALGRALAFKPPIRFEHSALFQNAVFLTKADFRYAQFTGNANFDSVNFFEGALFCHSVFDSLGQATFNWTRFCKDVSFQACSCFGITRFEHAVFDSCSEVHFGGSCFSGPVSFAYVEFRGTVHFGEECFKDAQSVTFHGATFSRTLDLRQQLLQPGLSFVGAQFKQGACFRGAVFGDSTSDVQNATFDFHSSSTGGNMDFSCASTK